MDKYFVTVLLFVLSLSALAKGEDVVVCPGDYISWTSCYVNKTNQLPWNAGATRRVINENMEVSYITARSGIQFGGDQTSGSILYEGQIFKNFTWWESKSSDKTKYWIDIPIRIGVRQLTIDSAPVRTPSYNPGIRMYWSYDSDSSPPKNGLWYQSVGIHHYSNGQDGRSTLPDGTVNTIDGSFSTNYLEWAIHRVGTGWLAGQIEQARLSIRRHFLQDWSWEKFQDDQYEKRHISLEMRTLEYFSDSHIPVQIKLSETYGHGYRYVVKNDINPSMNVEARRGDRFNTTLELTSRLKIGRTKWKDLALYLRYDYGHDYYNINFQHRINRLQIGVVSTNL